MIKYRDVSKLPLYPPLVNHPSKDLFSMIPVVYILVRILYIGRRETFEKFGMFGSSLYVAYVNGVVGGYYIGGDPGRNSVITKCITKTIWFERFVREVELQVGIKFIPYQTISIDVMNFLIEGMEA